MTRKETEAVSSLGRFPLNLHEYFKGGIRSLSRNLMSSFLSAGIVFLFLFAGACSTKKADCPEKVKEIIAINFAKEIMDGGYRAVSAEDFKKWVDAKKDMLIVDTMPLEASYKKRHIPGAVQMEFPIPEMKEMDDSKKAEFLKLLGNNKDRLIVFYCGIHRVHSKPQRGQVGP